MGFDVYSGAYSILEKEAGKQTWYHAPKKSTDPATSYEDRLHLYRQQILEKLEKKQQTKIPAIFVIPDDCDGEEAHRIALLVYRIFGADGTFSSLQCMRHATAASQASHNWRQYGVDQRTTLVVTVHSQRVCFALLTRQGDSLKEKAHVVLSRDEDTYVHKLEKFLQTDFCQKRPSIHEILWTGTDLAELARLKTMLPIWLRIPYHLPTPFLPSIMATKGAAETCLQLSLLPPPPYFPEQA